MNFIRGFIIVTVNRQHTKVGGEKCLGQQCTARCVCITNMCFTFLLISLGPLFV